MNLVPIMLGRDFVSRTLFRPASCLSYHTALKSQFQFQISHTRQVAQAEDEAKAPGSGQCWTLEPNCIKECKTSTEYALLQISFVTGMSITSHYYYQRPSR